MDYGSCQTSMIKNMPGMFSDDTPLNSIQLYHERHRPSKPVDRHWKRSMIRICHRDVTPPSENRELALNTLIERCFLCDNQDPSRSVPSIRTPQIFRKTNCLKNWEHTTDQGMGELYFYIFKLLSGPFLSLRGEKPLQANSPCEGRGLQTSLEGP